MHKKVCHCGLGELVGSTFAVDSGFIFKEIDAFLAVGLMGNPGCVVKHASISEALLLGIAIKTYFLW